MSHVFQPTDIIAVIGAGAMGRGIALVAAQAGHSVIVADLSDRALATASAAVSSDLIGLVVRGKVTAEEAAFIEARISWTTDYGQLAPARLVVEAIVENIHIKNELFQNIESIVGQDVIIATNTSSLSVTTLATDLMKPTRFAGLHFFNPAGVMKLVEVIAGAATAPDVIRNLTVLIASWNKIPVIVRDVPGFIVNRVARPYYSEGFLALAEGAASPEVIDHVLRTNGGFRMGPLELADLIGHDVNYAVAQSIYEAYDGQTRFVPQPIQSNLVAAGHLGKKTKRGFYDHELPVPPLKYLPEAKPCKVTLPDLQTAWAIEINGVHIQTGDGRSASRVSSELRKPVALIDWNRNPNVPSLAIAASDLGHDQALSAVSAMAAALGKKAVEIKDRPGLLVLRTIGQLANAAFDAVRDKVASPSDIDQAMVYGVNYPEGPLATAASFGHSRLEKALVHIAEETGEDMYLPGELLQRKEGKPYGT
jgi:3-hydroxybutyryl-CoA dehydrogenase